MVSTTVANRNAAGAPTPSPEPTTIGVLNSIAEIGAEPVTVRKSTPARPTAPFLSLWTSSRPEMSTLSARPVVLAKRAPADSPPVPGGAWVSDMQPASRQGLARAKRLIGGHEVPSRGRGWPGDRGVEMTRGRADAARRARSARDLMGDTSGPTMMTAVPLLDTPKWWHVPAGRSCERPRAAHLSGIIGADIASPDPDRNMIKSSMTIGLLGLAHTLD